MIINIRTYYFPSINHVWIWRFLNNQAPCDGDDFCAQHPTGSMTNLRLHPSLALALYLEALVLGLFQGALSLGADRFWYVTNSRSQLVDPWRSVSLQRIGWEDQDKAHIIKCRQIYVSKSCFILKCMNRN